jgi:hypothetical protein
MIYPNCNWNSETNNSETLLPISQNRIELNLAISRKLLVDSQFEIDACKHCKKNSCSQYIRLKHVFQSNHEQTNGTHLIQYSIAL